MKKICIVLICLSVQLFCKKYKFDDFFPKEKRTLKIAILSFYNSDKKNGKDINRLFTNSIANIWLSMYSIIKDHHFSEKELNSVKKTIYDDLIDEENDALSKLVEKRDSVIFLDIKGYEKITQISNIKKSIKEQRKKIDFIKKQDYKKIKLDDTWEIKLDRSLIDYKFLVKDENFLLQEVKKISKDKQFDYVIYGFLKKIDDYNNVQTFLYNRFFKKVTKQVAFSSLNQNLTNTSYKKGQDYISYLMGTEFSSFEIKTNVSDAYIYINNKLKGQGDYLESFSSPKIANIKITREGYKEFKGVVVIGNEKNKTINIVLEKEKEKKYLIKTSPSGADIYLNSVWAGYSPLFINSIKNKDLVMLKMQEYNDKIVSTKDISKPVNMELNLIDYDLAYEKNKQYFRTSIILFASSLIIPIIFGGLYENSYNNLKNNESELSEKEYDRIFNQQNAYKWTRNGGIVLSAFLFINLTISIVRYIQASENLFNAKIR